jgi:hypothetical protein
LGNSFFQKNPLYGLKSYFSSQKNANIHQEKTKTTALLFRIKCTTILVYVLYTGIRYVYQYNNGM